MDNLIAAVPDIEFHLWLLSRGDGGCCVEARYFPDGWYAAIKPLMYHWTMIVGQVGDRSSFVDRWCYSDRAAAERGLRTWSGEGDPTGWHKHPATNRCRPDGDPARETIGWPRHARVE